MWASKPNNTPSCPVSRRKEITRHTGYSLSMIDSNLIPWFIVEDIEMNDGSAEKPYFMSDSLKDILHIENRAQPDGTEEGGKK